MNAYHEFIEPTRVSHAVACNFITPTERHLIVSKASLLQIFELNNNKLHLVQQFPLHGHITDIKAIRTTENQQLDYLAVSTRLAKFSVVRWDHINHTLATVSLHYYEAMLQDATFERLSTARLLVEPTYNSCAALRFKNLVAFLPLVVDDEEIGDDDIDHDHERGEKRPADQYFYPSFLMDGASLDASVGDIIDMQFMHNFREPTLAVLSQTARAWAGNLIKVRDTVQFLVLTLDPVTKSAVLVLKVENLPYDVDRVVPLAAPLNGCLLMGCNELIHVDNGGIVRRIAVNEYTASITASTKNYTDCTRYGLELEHAHIVALPNDTRCLLVSRGRFFYVTFVVDGKSIKSVSLDEVPAERYEGVVVGTLATTAVLDRGMLFLGNDTGDSVLVEAAYEEKEKAQDGENRENGKEQDEKELDEKEHENGENGKQKKANDDSDFSDDDLYDDDETEQQTQIQHSAIQFVAHDRLVNNGPTAAFTMGYYTTDKYKSNLANPNANEVSIVANAGTHHETSLNIITPSIQPTVLSSLSFLQIDRMWTVHRRYLVTSDAVNNKLEIFQIENNYARMAAADFVNDEATLAVHEMDDGKFILQVTPRQIRVYDDSFAECVSLTSDIGTQEIVNATAKDEVLMVFLSSGDVMIFTVNTYARTYARIDIPKILSDTIITTGCITNSRLLAAVLKDVNLVLRGTKRRHGDKDTSATSGGDGQEYTPQKTFVLATGDNRIVAFNRFHNQRCYQLNDVSRFLEHLTLGFFDPSAADPDPLIKQLILGDLGDLHHTEEYLTVLTIGGELIMYKLYFDGENFRFIKEHNVPVTGAPHNAYPLGTAIERRMAYLPKLNGYRGIFVTGLTPYLILKPVHAPVRVFRFLKMEAVSVAPYFDRSASDKIVFLDLKKNARVCALPADFCYENRWPIKRVPIGELVKLVSYHETSHTYVVSTFREVAYDCLDEEGKPIVGTDPERPGARAHKGTIRLLSPVSWTVIDQIELADNEVGMSVKSMVLDVGSSVKKFKNKKEFVVVGTGKYRLEDLSANGAFMVLEVIDIIPEPGKPETNHKFKEVCREDVRGAATAICDVSGRFLVAQGQKVIVRDLQDNGVVPVAFLDTAVYVSEAKSFGNLVLLGDSLKSVWLVGFDAEPFRMIMLGKDRQRGVDVNCADFVVRDREIFLVVADNNNVLHVLQYNPEDAFLLNGQRLLHRASFQLNLNVTCMRTVPTMEQAYDHERKEKLERVSGNFQTLGCTGDGLFFTVFPVGESTYRRMYILQQQLIDKEYHHCGLNPRLNRLGGLVFSDADVNSKPVLDWDVLRRFSKLNNDRKAQFAAKAGSGGEGVWRDIVEMENMVRL